MVRLLIVLILGYRGRRQRWSRPRYDRSVTWPPGSCGSRWGSPSSTISRPPGRRVP